MKNKELCVEQIYLYYDIHGVSFMNGGKAAVILQRRFKRQRETWNGKSVDEKFQFYTDGIIYLVRLSVQGVA